MDEKEVLLSMYNEQVTQARQHETLRATATNLTFVAGAVLISLLFNGGQLIENREALAATLIGVGLFGVLFSLKHYERNRHHVAIARRYREELENKLPESGITELRKLGREANEREHPWVSKLRLNWLWSSSSLVFVIVGGWYFLENRTFC